MDNGIIDDAARFAGGGFGAMSAVLLARWLILWLTGRHDRREDRLDRRWSEYMDATDKRMHELEQRSDRLEKEVETCHLEKRALMEELSKRIGYANGRGEAAQVAQIDTSLKNMFDRGASE